MSWRSSGITIFEKLGRLGVAVLAGLLVVFGPVREGWSGGSYGAIRSDSDLLKDKGYWRSKVPYLPMFRLRLGVGFTPAYFAPANVETSPYVTSSLSISSSISLGQFGVKGYWRDLGLSMSWGLTKYLTDNLGGSRYARQLYSRDIGVSLGKTLFVEPNTGISFSGGVSFKIPVSLFSRQKTLITSVAPGISIGKSFLSGRISLGFSWGANFNFYYQDSGLYHPDLAGIPRLNKRWGMNFGFSSSFGIIRGLRVNAGLNVGVGYSFADNYQNPEGPQVYGAEGLSPADLASYAINESNYYSLSIGISYRISRFIGISASYSNGGAQFEYQYDAQGNARYVLRNPFKLQNGSFAFGISGRI